MTRAIHIQAIFYNNPDLYPPIVNSARLLAQAGITLDLFCREDGGQWRVSYPAGAQVRRIDTRAGSSWREYGGFVAQVIRRADKHAALFVGHDMHGLLPARLLASRYHRPLVYHCHDYAERRSPLPLGSRLVRAFQQAFARTADLVVVPDAERGAVMAQELRLKRSPLAVANAPLARPAEGGQALRQALYQQGLALEQVVFRQGRIGTGHAIEVTLHSMPLWTDKTWGFVVMGVGEPAYLDRLSALAQALGVERRFAILPPVGYDEVAHFTPGADLGHALYEPVHINNVHIATASNKIMEYMAAGLPLLVSDTPALRALVERYGCGLTADHNRPESVAATVNCLLGDPARARQMGAAAARAFEQVFCYERQFAPALDAIRALINGKPYE